jgi:WD40 repeat protein
VRQSTDKRIRTFKLPLQGPVKPANNKTVKPNYLLLFFVVVLCLPVNAQQPAHRVQIGHLAPVGAVAYSPDGKWMASGDASGLVKLWITLGGRELRDLEGHSEAIHQLVFSPDGQTLVSASEDGTMVWWEAKTGKKLRISYGHEGGVTSLAFAPNGTWLASVGRDRTLRIWETAVGREIKLIDDHQAPLLALAVSADGKWLATAGEDQLVKIWEMPYCRLVRELKGHTGAIHALKFSPNLPVLASGSADKTIKLWDFNSGNQIRTLFGHLGSVHALSFGQEGKILLSGSADQQLLVWDLQSYRELLALTGHQGAVRALDYEPRSGYLVSASDDKTLQVWDPGSRYPVMVLKSNASPLKAVAYSPSGRFFVTGSASGILRIWSMESGRPAFQVQAHQAAITSLAYSPDGGILVTASADKTMKAWDAGNGKLLRTFQGHAARVNAVCYSPDGDLIASASDDETIRIWSAATATSKETLFGHTAPVLSISFSANGKQVASGGLDQSVKIWSVNERKPLKSLEGHQGGVTSVAFSPDGTRIASASLDETLKLWEMPSGKALHTLQGTSAPVLSVVFSPDGAYLASGSANKLVRTWRVDSGKLSRTFWEHEGPVNSLCYSQDGRYLFTASDDQQLKIWDMAEGEPLLNLVAFDNGRDYVIHNAEGQFFGTQIGVERGLHFLRDGSVIPLSALYDQFYQTELWDMALFGKPLHGNAKDIGTIKPAPEVFFLSPRPSQNLPGFTRSAKGIMSEKETIKVKVEAVDQGGGVEEIKLFQNGKLVYRSAPFQKKTQEGESVTIETEVTLIEGMNDLTVVAVSSQRTESPPDMLRLAYKSFVAPQADLYLLVVGVNEYLNERYNLNYAKPDAAAVLNALQVGGKPIFRKIIAQAIYDKEATAGSVIGAFESIIKNAREQDVFVFYFAGHGTVFQDQGGQETYYLCPTDVTSLYGNERILKDKAISSEKLRDLCRSIKAQKQLVLLDACHSGAATKTFTARGAAEEKAMVQLARSSGMALIAASDTEQYATEVEKLGHGIFTYALLQGLKGAADGANGDRKITVGELRNYLEDIIPVLSEQHRGKPQFPTAFFTGQDFPIAITQTESSEK